MAMQKTETYIDVMTDLETTDTEPNAAIAAIGATVFDRQSGQLGNRFYVSIDISTSVADGGVISAETFKWRMAQTSTARQSFAGTAHIHSALHQFGNWLQLQRTTPDSEIRIWGNGPDFDMVVLSQSYKRAGMVLPWKFWNVRCFRTLKAEYPSIPMERSGTHHNALDDAITQAKHVLRIDAELAKTIEPEGAVAARPIPGELVTIEADHDMRRLGFIMCIAIALGVISTIANLAHYIF